MLHKKIIMALGAAALLLGSFTSAAHANYHVNSNNNMSVTTSSFIGGFNFTQTRLFTFMDGEQEVPGPGDPNGFGYAKVKVYPDEGLVCAKLRVFSIEPATAAHIHEAPFGQAGPVVVTLPTPNANGYANGCVSADSGELEDITENPSAYYVNVHNTPYPDGALRGQL